MVDQGAILDALVLLGTSAVYLYVGYVTGRRRVGGEGQLAVSLFSLWWLTLGVVSLSGVGSRVLGMLGILELGLHVTILHMAILAIVLAFWALEYYLVYLFTGSRKWLVPISAYYVALYVWLVYLIVWRHPTGATFADGVVTIAYENTVSGGMSAALGLAFLLPTIGGALGYARLFFRVDEPTQRYRIGLVSGTIILWFGLSLLALGLHINTAPWWQELSRYFGLVAALLIFAAYRPPGFIRRRWGIHAVDERGEGAG